MGCRSISTQFKSAPHPAVRIHSDACQEASERCTHCRQDSPDSSLHLCIPLACLALGRTAVSTSLHCSLTHLYPAPCLPHLPQSHVTFVCAAGCLCLRLSSAPPAEMGASNGRLKNFFHYVSTLYAATPHARSRTALHHCAQTATGNNARRSRQEWNRTLIERTVCALFVCCSLFAGDCPNRAHSQCSRVSHSHAGAAAHSWLHHRIWPHLQESLSGDRVRTSGSSQSRMGPS
jgi:hypothetical protein